MNEKTTLLDDSPATCDAFGAHQRIANAVLQMVENEPGGKAIALIGRWGSGKSTVVNLAQNAARENVGVFVFDAWAHQGDPLRRTFLEEFCNFLEKKGWLHRATAGQIRNELSGGYKKSTKTTTPHLTGWGIVFGFALFFEAIGLAMLSGGNSPPWWLKLGIGLSVIVPVLGVVAFCWHLLSGRCRKSPVAGGGVFLGLLVNKQVEKASTVTSSTPEPTSVEFQQKFGQVAEAALTEGRKLLLVIDNLDRVDPQDALQLWSVMRTFIDFPVLKSNQWSKNLWVMAAFDGTRIRRLWENAPGKAGDSEKNGRGDLSTAFLEKTFQIRINVPVPLLLDWRAFLASRLERALPEESVDDLYNVLQVFATMAAEGDPPTPRKIVSFVNQLVATQRVLADPEIPLAQQALYAILAENGWTQGDQVVNLEKVAHYLGPDWEANSRALYFGATKDQANQLKFDAAIEQALTNGNPDSVSQFAEAGWISHAVAEFSRRRVPEWQAHDPAMLARFAYILSCDSLKGKYPPQIDRQVFNGIVRTREWPNLDGAAGKGIAAVVPGLKKDALANILRAISRPPIEQPDQPPELQKWIAGVGEVLRAVDGAGWQESIAKHFRIGPTAQRYCEVLAKAGEILDPETLLDFRPEADPGDIVKVLNSKASALTLNPSDEEAVMRMRAVDVEWPWGNFTELARRIQSQQPAQSEQAGRCARIMLLLRANDQIRKQVKDCATSGHVLLQLSIAQAANDIGAIVNLVLLQLIGNAQANFTQDLTINVNGRASSSSDGRNHYRVLASSPGQRPQFLPMMLELVRQTDSVDDLLANTPQNDPAWAAVKAIIATIASQSPSAISPNSIVKHYPILRAIDNESTKKLISGCAAGGPMNAILSGAKLELENCELFRQVLEESPTESLKNHLAAELESLPTETWREAMQNGGGIIPLLRELRGSGTSLEIGYQLQDAMTALAKEAAAGAPRPKLSSVDWRCLADSLKQDQRVMLAKNIVGTFVNAADSSRSLSGLIDLLAEMPEKGEEFSDKADDVVRVIFKSILARQDETEYSWMAEILDPASGLLEKCQPATLKDFTERAEGNCLGQISDQCRAILTKILDRLDPNRQSLPPGEDPPPEKRTAGD